MPAETPSTVTQNSGPVSDGANPIAANPNPGATGQGVADHGNGRGAAPHPPGTSRSDLLTGLLNALFAAHTAGDHEAANRCLLALLQGLDQAPLSGVDASERRLFGHLLVGALGIVVQPGFRVLETYAFALLMHNAMIANLMAGCLNSTTDAWIAVLPGQEQDLFKTLLLYSARNRMEVDIAQLLFAHPDLVSKWLYQTWKVVFSGNCNETVAENLTRFLARIDHRIRPASDLQELYFGCTYLGIHEERRAKELINHTLQQHLKMPIRNRPNPRRVAVFSDFWFRGHSVHRTLGQYIAALSPDFELTLLHSIRAADQLDTSLFSSVLRIGFDGAQIDPQPVAKNDFAAVIFPDIGMTLPSIVLANLRIAPVQIMMTGHPVSTYGAHIDYFIGGSAVDLPIIAEQSYSERLVLLPGYGAVHEEPTYQRQQRRKTCAEILISGSWNSQKIHWRYLRLLNQALQQCRNPVRLRIFAGQAPTLHRGYPAFVADIARQLEHCRVELVPHRPYAEYMALMEEADFAIDAFPFAGSNTVSDNLHLRKPVLVREGHRWFNRIGPAMLRAAGLPDLIANTDADYARKLVRLVDDEAYRTEVSTRLAAADLEHTVYSVQGAPEFAQFLRNVTRDPKHYPGREPISLGPDAVA